MRSIIFFMLFLVLGSCSKESEYAPIDSKLDIRSSNKDVLKVSYKLKTKTVFDLPEESSMIDKFASNPLSGYSKIEMTVRSDGSTKLITDKLENSSSLEYRNHASIRNNEAGKVVKTIQDGNSLIGYNSQGDLVGSSIAVTPINLSELVEQINNLPDETELKGQEIFQSCMKDFIKVDSLIELIQNPPNGVKINHISDVIKAIAMPIKSYTKGSGQPSVASQIVNIDKMLILSTKLYGEDGKALMCTIFRYQDCILKGFKQEKKETLPSGQVVETTLHADIEDFKFEIL